jgi:hypothetical protein
VQLQENCTNECLVLKVRNSGTELELFDFEFGTVEICYQYVISMLTLIFFQFGPPLLETGFDQRSRAHLARRGRNHICDTNISPEKSM